MNSGKFQSGAAGGGVVTFCAPDARVLVVDDMSINLEVTEFMLSPYNMQIDTCQSGGEAVQAAKTSRYDLILMDHMMPEMDGVEAAKLIRESGGANAEVPIVALTANTVLGAEEMFLQSSFNGFLAKPIDTDRLDTVLSEWIPKEKQKPPVEEADRKTGTNTAVKGFEGVDVDLGLARTGGMPDVFLRILTVFGKDGRAKIGEIKKCLETGNLPLFTTYVHALKGAAANIGAMGLSYAAKALETAGQKKDRAFISANTPLLLADLELLLRGIDEVVSAGKRDSRCEESGDEEALKSALSNLNAAIKELRPATINAAVRNLRNFENAENVGSKIENILQNVLIGEHGEAAAQIKTFGPLPEPQKTPPDGKKTIFLVDDDPTNLMSVLCAIEGHYGVLTLNSGEKLLNALEKKIPYLILLDIEMPGMNGYDTIKAIKNKKETADIPVIFLTAKSDGESELEGLTLGAIDYISKPTPPPALLLKRIEVHLLVEDQKHELLEQKQVLIRQKAELVNFNNNLRTMVEAKTRSVVELQHAILKTMAELLECRDDITGGHIERTTRYLGILFSVISERGLYRETIESWDTNLILQSSQLHDVGKIAVKDSILLKPGKLTPEEFEEIKQHTVFGEQIIEKIKQSTSEKEFLEHAKIFAATHHEKWDGSGYPRGLKGVEIPLKGRLMAIADVYDALISDRPYKKAFSHEEAVGIILSGKGMHFDPDLVDLFIDVSGEFNKVREEPSDKY